MVYSVTTFPVGDASHRQKIAEHFCRDLIGMREKLFEEEHHLTLLEDIQERSMTDLKDLEEGRLSHRDIALYYSFLSTLCDRIECQKTRLDVTRREYEDKRQELLTIQLKGAEGDSAKDARKIRPRKQLGSHLGAMKKSKKGFIGS